MTLTSTAPNARELDKKNRDSGYGTGKRRKVNHIRELSGEIWEKTGNKLGRNVLSTVKSRGTVVYFAFTRFPRKSKN